MILFFVANEILPTIFRVVGQLTLMLMCECSCRFLQIGEIIHTPMTSKPRLSGDVRKEQAIKSINDSFLRAFFSQV
jgi:hypothetical protein